MAKRRAGDALEVAARALEAERLRRPLPPPTATGAHLTGLQRLLDLQDDTDHDTEEDASGA